MEKIHLQSVGKVPAIAAGELKVGDVRMYNFGSTATIVRVYPKTEKTITVVIYDKENNKFYLDNIRKTTLVAVVKRDQDVSEMNPEVVQDTSRRPFTQITLADFEAKLNGNKKSVQPEAAQQATGENITINHEQEQPQQEQDITNEEQTDNKNNITEPEQPAQKEDNANMKTLIFEGAGWEKAESSIKSGVGNCRIRTRIRNNDGRLIYLEMTGFIHSGNNVPQFAKGFDCVGNVSHCFYADSKWDSNRSYSEGLRDIERGHFEYTKENIIKFVNENLNCSFDDMQVINDGSIRVHDTQEPLCDCSTGEYEEYKDIEVNISVLDKVEPLHEFSSHRMAQYQISYDFVKQNINIKKWIEERQKMEQDKYPNYTYYVTLRWDAEGVITSAEISARQNFCNMGIGLQSLVSVLDDVLKQNKELQVV